MSIKSNKKYKSDNPEDIFDPDSDNAIVIKDLVKNFDDVIAVNGLNLEINTDRSGHSQYHQERVH